MSQQEENKKDKINSIKQMQNVIGGIQLTSDELNKLSFDDLYRLQYNLITIVVNKLKK